MSEQTEKGKANKRLQVTNKEYREGYDRIFNDDCMCCYNCVKKFGCDSYKRLKGTGIDKKNFTCFDFVGSQGNQI